MSGDKTDKAFVDEEAPTPAPSEVGGKNWQTDSTKGLSTSEVEQSLEAWGKNEIEVEITPLYVLFLRQFTGFMPFLIELAAIISLAVQVSFVPSLRLIFVVVRYLLSKNVSHHEHLSPPSCNFKIVNAGLRRLCHCMWHALGERLPWLPRGISCQEESG